MTSSKTKTVGYHQLNKSLDFYKGKITDALARSSDNMKKLNKTLSGLKNIEINIDKSNVKSSQVTSSAEHSH